MGFFSRIMSFEEPMGATLTRLLYYFGCFWIIYSGAKRLWTGFSSIPDQWWWATKYILWTPFWIIIAWMVLRVVTEFVLAQFRIDKSTHDQVTGRGAPPPVAKAD